MHELAIVEDLINLCEKNLKANVDKNLEISNNLPQIKEIFVKVGRLSGVEAHYLQSCYDVFREGTVCENATMHIHVQDVVIECLDCNKQSTLKENRFACPICDSQQIKVIDGEDLYLMRMVIE